jgi:hypothetical protein
MGWADYDYRIAGVDPGGGDPTAIVPLGIWIPKDKDGHPLGMWKAHQVDEYYDKTGQSTADQLISFLAKWDDEAPFDFVVIDVAGGTVLMNTIGAYFNKRGRQRVWPADKDRDGGIRDTRQLIVDNRLTIDPTCVAGIAEFPGYRWRESIDPNGHVRYITGTPVDHHADEMDSRRYAIRAMTNAMLSKVGGGNRSTSVEVKTDGGRSLRKRPIRMY